MTKEITEQEIQEWENKIDNMTQKKIIENKQRKEKRKMLVETYEVTESADKTKVEGEEFEQFKSMIESLNLEGQQKFIQDKEVNPYRKMTSQESVVYGILCPTKTELKNFSESMIPLRVLQLATHVNSLNFIDVLEVWHSDNADIKDPVLVGRKGTSWNGEYFILARWGETLMPFNELMQKAKDVLIIELRNKANEAKQTLERFEKNIENYIQGFLNKGKVPDISLYIQ